MGSLAIDHGIGFRGDIGITIDFFTPPVNMMINMASKWHNPGIVMGYKWDRPFGNLLQFAIDLLSNFMIDLAKKRW